MEPPLPSTRPDALKCSRRPHTPNRSFYFLGAGRVAGFIAVTATILLGLGWAAGQPFWVDEEMLALNLRNRSFSLLGGPLWLDQSAPLGWLALQRLVLLIFGDTERALRLVPFLFGVGTLVCSAWIGGRWLGMVGAGTFTLLCAFGPWLAYHALELKPYSADAFWALLLLGLAASLVEKDRDPEAARNQDVARARRSLVTWWGLAAVGQLFGNGALLVMPACAAVLHVVLWRRHGRRILGAAMLGVAAWTGLFGLHYLLALRHSMQSEALRRYWSFAMAPAGAGVDGFIAWAGRAMWSLANKPAGTDHQAVFWLVVAAGTLLVLRAQAAKGLLLALLPLSALAWGALRLMPLYERLSLWVVPPLYLSVAVLAEWSARMVIRAVHGPRAPTPANVKAARSGIAVSRAAARWVLGAAAVLGLLAAGIVVVTVVRNGSDQVLRQRGGGNHEVNDRDAVDWLMKQRRRGDVIVTTKLALPAVWWYGRLAFPPGRAQRAVNGPGADIEVFQAELLPRSGPCPMASADQLGRPRRVLVYLGFRSDDWPEAREDLLLGALAEQGAIVGFRPFAQRGGGLVVDMERPPAPGQKLPPRPWAGPADITRSTRVDGCVHFQPGRPW